MPSSLDHRFEEHPLFRVQRKPGRIVESRRDGDLDVVHQAIAFAGGCETEQFLDVLRIHLDAVGG